MEAQEYLRYVCEMLGAAGELGMNWWRVLALYGCSAVGEGLRERSTTAGDDRAEEGEIRRRSREGGEG